MHPSKVISPGFIRTRYLIWYPMASWYSSKVSHEQQIWWLNSVFLVNQKTEQWSFGQPNWLISIMSQESWITTTSKFTGNMQLQSTEQYEQYILWYLIYLKICTCINMSRKKCNFRNQNALLFGALIHEATRWQPLNFWDEFLRSSGTPQQGVVSPVLIASRQISATSFWCRWCWQTCEIRSGSSRRRNSSSRKSSTRWKRRKTKTTTFGTTPISVTVVRNIIPGH